MKTTLMQQVIAVAIFSVAMTRTFATPMPITDQRTDHVLLSTRGHDPHRNQLAAPIPAILQSAIDKVTQRFGELRLQLPPDITSTSELLQSTLAAHEIRTKLLSSANEFANLAIQGVSMSIQHVASLLKRHRELGIDETRGTPLIEQLIKILEDVLLDHFDDEEEDVMEFGGLVSGQIVQILELNLGWKVMDELKRVQSQIPANHNHLHHNHLHVHNH